MSAHIFTMSSLKIFLSRILALVLISLLVVIGLVIIQQIWGTFTPLIDYLNQDLQAVDSTLGAELVAGISLGGLVVFLILLLIPILTPGVNTKNFLSAFFRGLLASAVFLATNYFYARMEELGRFYLLASMALAIVVTFVLIEIIALSGRKEDQKAVRTDLSASIASGLAFGLILELVGFALKNLGLVIK